MESDISTQEIKPESGWGAHLAAGFYATLVMLALMFVARLTLRTPLVPELVADRIFALLPISLIEFGVQTVGIYAKKIAFVGCVFLFIAVASLVGALACRVFKNLPERPIRAGVFLYAAAFWYVSLGLAMPGFASAIFTGVTIQMALGAIVLLAIYIIYGVALGPSLAHLARRSEAESLTTVISRRALLASLAVVAAGSFLYTFLGKFSTQISRGIRGRVADGDGIFPNINGLSLEVTPTPDFYHVSKNVIDPEVDVTGWSLEIKGLVSQPLKLSHADIKAMESVEEYATLECISNPVGGDLIGNALWKGVRLRDVLERAGIKSGVRDVVLRAADDYSDSIPLDRAMQEGTLLAYEMNGAPLTATHGFPLRLIVPGIFGMKNVKWITQIELVDHDYKGYWQERGWDDRAEYKTMSRIDVPEATASRAGTVVAGVAFAGDRGVSRVEVSTDGGTTWQQAELREPLSPYSWVLWQHAWTPNQAGTFKLLVRATDGRGAVQTAEEAEPIPDGASGHHQRTITSQ
jgi:DMSO/TMAO reductase YedYZ molybdopterin-dependent catalytic subunit